MARVLVASLLAAVLLTPPVSLAGPAGTAGRALRPGVFSNAVVLAGRAAAFLSGPAPLKQSLDTFAQCSPELALGADAACLRGCDASKDACDGKCSMGFNGCLAQCPMIGFACDASCRAAALMCRGSCGRAHDSCFGHCTDRGGRESKSIPGRVPGQ